MNGKRKKTMTMKEKCKNWAGLDGNPGLRPWPKSRAPALTRAGPQGLNREMNLHRSTMINDDRVISCAIGSMADQIDHEPTQFMPGILYHRSIAEDSFNFISFPVLKKSK